MSRYAPYRNRTLDNPTFTWGAGETHRRLSISRLRRATRVDRCRWPRPDANGYCIHCGWQLIPVQQDLVIGETTVVPHFRHKRQKGRSRLSTSASRRTHINGSDEGGQEPSLNLIRAGVVLCEHLNGVSSNHRHNRALRHFGERILAPLTSADYATWKAGIGA